MESVLPVDVRSFFSKDYFLHFIIYRHSQNKTYKRVEVSISCSSLNTSVEKTLITWSFQTITTVDQTQTVVDVIYVVFMEILQTLKVRKFPKVPNKKRSQLMILLVYNILFLFPLHCHSVSKDETFLQDFLVILSTGKFRRNV